MSSRSPTRSGCAPICPRPNWAASGHALVVIRDSFLENPSLTTLLPQFTAMAILAAISLVAAGWLFRKRSV
ncbi:hypothetical protein GCM10010909_34470 [Acidocella aquatica]|uniref:IPTL-CTERM sorting domain-containing protein n=1 Tax=Acidocella aquatica TaxID=1922313 RepID=A0ABQ6AFG2_9PROT|nr:hypothetical protein GCM10010909_34470 [Acidocella aquatica]